ncbi:MAG: helix-turn-helix domain-containing protein [Granulosicoccus sp.]|nr:helix-turn-helix domain-containing protein [Granulosicoccus sp.]
MAEHSDAHIQAVARMLASDGTINLAFVREHGQLRAEQHFPLEATLHAYRCGHKVISHWIRETILTHATDTENSQQLTAAVADFVLEYTDTVSRLFTSAYLEQFQLMADVAGDKRSYLLSQLIEGYDESDGRITNLLRDEGYLSGRLVFCVALIRTLDPAELLNPHRARRLVQAVEQGYQRSGVRRLIHIRDSRIIIIFSDVHRKSGWTAASTELASRVSVHLETLGTTILAGVSNDVFATAQLPAAHREAQHALKLATVSQRLVLYSRLGALQIMQYIAQEEFSKVLPQWAATLNDANRKSAGVLCSTVRAYARADMNAQLAAKSLGAHPNTIYARFERIHAATGLDPKTFSGLSDLLVVFACLEARGDTRSAS